MILRRLTPVDGDAVAIDTSAPDARERIAALYPPVPLRVNLVATLDGGTSDAQGTSAGITCLLYTSPSPRDS